MPANTWMVNLTTDTGVGNLATHTGDIRYCITNAGLGDTINFDPTVFTNNQGQGTTIKLTQGEIAIKTSLTIANQTGNPITIDAQNNAQNTSRIFDITGAGLTETISNLALINGNAPGTTEPNPGEGGAIYDQGTLTLNSDTFTNDNASTTGGAVYNVATPGVTGTLTVNGPNSMFRTDSAGIGGAIYVTPTAGVANNVVLSNTSFTSDTAKVGGGGAVEAGGVASTTMQVTACTFTGNQVTGTGDGGAIDTTDQLTISCPFPGPQTTFTNNSATNGGAIAYEPLTNSNSSLQLTNVTFTTNKAAAGGGVYISFDNGTAGTVNVTITGSLFNGNQATLSGATNNGGGLYYYALTSETASASLKITNSTFYDNYVNENGGGLLLTMANAGTGNNNATLTSLTVYNNQAANSGGGLYATLFDAFLQLHNSIVAGNTIENPPSSGPDVFISGNTQDFTSQGYNLIGIHDPADGATWIASDRVGTAANPANPVLDPNGLAYNGGPTQTIKVLQSTTGAYRNGDPTLVGSLDQRGLTRKQYVSIGAYDPDAS